MEWLLSPIIIHVAFWIFTSLASFLVIGIIRNFSHMITKILVSFSAGNLGSHVTQNLIIDHWLPATNDNCLFNWNLLVV